MAAGTALGGRPTLERPLPLPSALLRLPRWTPLPCRSAAAAQLCAGLYGLALLRQCMGPRVWRKAPVGPELRERQPRRLRAAAAGSLGALGAQAGMARLHKAAIAVAVSHARPEASSSGRRTCSQSVSSEDAGSWFLARPRSLLDVDVPWGMRAGPRPRLSAPASSAAANALAGLLCRACGAAIGCVQSTRVSLDEPDDARATPAALRRPNSRLAAPLRLPEGGCRPPAAAQAGSQQAGFVGSARATRRSPPPDSGPTRKPGTPAATRCARQCGWQGQVRAGVLVTA